MSNDGFLDPYRDTIIKIVTKQVLAALILRLPFLSFGPAAYMASYFLSKIFEIALDKTILGINLAVIDWKIDQEVSELRELLDIVKKIPPEDVDARDKVEQEIIKSARDLISLRDKPRL
jgi:hypothetical protein